MRGNKLSFLFAAFSIILLVVCIVILAGKDRTAPVMSFSDTDVIYSADMDKQQLYEGVTAVDNRDGDITDKIVIEKIVQSVDGKSVSITYAVNDNANNFTKKVRIFDQLVVEVVTEVKVDEKADVEAAAAQQQAAEEQAKKDMEEKAKAEAEEQLKKEAEENAKKEAEEQLKKEAEEKAKKDAEEKAKKDAAEQSLEAIPSSDGAKKSQPPILELAEKEVTTRVGVRPAWVNVIKTIKDDNDNYDTLYKNLTLDGTYTDNKAGDYDVTVRTVDSDGNKSAACKLTIHVLP